MDRNRGVGINLRGYAANHVQERGAMPHCYVQAISPLTLVGASRLTDASEGVNVPG